MTPEQISAVKASFAKVVPITDTAATLFYGRLFEIAPEVKPLFKGSMDEQGRKLMMTLGMVVNGLHDLTPILPAVRQLAVKHVGYGVEPAHYEHVGSALLWTLEKGLGEAFTPDLRQAWTIAYAALSSTMIAAAYPAASGNRP